MAQPTTTFLDELMAAARGCVALLVGQRDASGHFDFSQRGLVGSFIAVVLGIGLSALGPQPLIDPSGGTIASTAVLVLESLVIGVQFGVAWLVLRSDGFVPFMIVQNWALFFQAILAEASILFFGPAVVMAGDVPQLTNGILPLSILGILVFIVAINVARLILTLRPLHVVLFVGAIMVLPPLLGTILPVG